VAVSEYHDRYVVRVDLFIFFYLEKIYSGVFFTGTCVAIVFMTFFAIDAWALVLAWETLRAASIAWEANTRRSTWHAIIAFMFTRLGTALNTWCTWFIAS
jgi:hypothetical protein